MVIVEASRIHFNSSHFFLLSPPSAENLLSLKRYSKRKVKELGKADLVLKEKNLLKSIRQSVFVPRVICTSADESYAGLLLDSHIACSLTSIIHTPLDETSAKFCAASVVIALESLHKVGYTYQIEFPLCEYFP